MRLSLELHGMPIDSRGIIPPGLYARFRKGKAYLYLRMEGDNLDPPATYDDTGVKTTPTGMIYPVKVKAEE